MSENRKFERVSKQIKAEVHQPDGMTFSTSIDISIAGIFISTPEPHEPGTELNLALKTGDTDFINIKGIVRWIKDELDNDDNEQKTNTLGMGIEFVGVNPVDMKKIEQLLNS